MIKIVILGGGNVALHLFSALKSDAGISVVQIYNRSIKKLEHLRNEIALTNNLSELVPADIYIIAVTDDAIAGVANALKDREALVVHTSGSASLEDLKPNKRRGSFYPLQTFSKEKQVDFRTIPICIEAENEADLDLLHRVASAISSQVVPISTQQRQALHVAAVFVNNFTNHLYFVGSEICEQNKLSFDLLKPLIKETAQKLEMLDPFSAQTGPARRHDISTLTRHENQLKQENHKAIYKLLSASITTTYGKKL